MKRIYPHLRAAPGLLRAVVLACLSLPIAAMSASLSLTNVPLSTATTTTVKPNLMFILDNSGSMNWDYLPDLVVDGNYCKGTGAGTTYRCCRNQDGTSLSSSTTTSTCLPTSSGMRGMPPFYSSDFNKAYYDPAITYSVPRNYDGTEKDSYDGNSNVPLDGYQIQTTNTMNLKTGYPDLEWCTDTSYSDCLRNDNYLLPGKINGKTYDKMHATTVSLAQGTNFATGTVAAPTTSSRSAGPFYYVMVPGEYCSDVKLTTCQAATSATSAYPYPAKVRWCKNSDLTECQATQNSTYIYPRYPTVIITAATDASASYGKITASNMPRSNRIDGERATGTGSTCSDTNADNKAVVTSIKLNGQELLTSSFTYCDGSDDQGRRNENLANQIRSRIGNGFSASRNNAVLTITAPDATYNGASLTYNITKAILTVTQDFAHGSSTDTPAVAVPGSFKRIDIVSGQTYGNIVENGQTIVDRSNRTDCASAPNCTYAEELKNFANWFAWYRTRMQMMKTSVSRAFSSIDNRYRAGFFALNNQSSNYLKINTFNAGAGQQKQSWYSKLFNADPSGGTPLRSTLAKVGRIFAGKNPLGVSGGDDPMQYSCQQNFAILTTDGYWNTDASTDVKDISGSTLGNLDGGSTPRPMYEGPTASSGSLADVAMYYYETDLRTPALENCTGNLGAGIDVCKNDVFVSGADNNIQQHMTTFTLGLGIDGTLQYIKDYKTAGSGDYYNIKNNSGTPSNWPVPREETATAIDDLWHAAVNGRGTYFSAKNPNQLSQGINEALASISMRRGAGAAAATSSLNPVAGDNYAYVASYTTVKWQGNLEARTINLTTGNVSEDASWCVENIVAGVCNSPSTIVHDSSGSGSAYYCVTPDATADTCPSPNILDGSNCKTPMATSCTGKMAAKIHPASDDRAIYTSNGSSLVPFGYDQLSAPQKSYFSSTVMQGLSQWSALTSTQKLNATADNLINYLRGQTGHEDRSSNDESRRIFRYREATLGDAMEAEPAFVGKPGYSYIDPGYSEFKASKASRPKTIYLGTNDGMLHAFNADDGTERWAYIPSMVLPNLWKLADKNYASMHTNYVNGSPIVADVYSGSQWKTILVAGLNGGGRGYYALDVTDPSSPSLLWEIDSSTDNDIGYTYGQPVITKKSDGTWVVLFTSGHNNTGPGSGRGYLYVRNALTGAPISKLGTGAGDTTTPSGLSRIAAWADEPMKNNTATFAYGGDLFGSVWRFDVSTGSVIKFAELKDGNGTAQPVTTAPELGLIEKKRVVFVATGKYLETADLSDTQTQSIYAIKDDDSGTTLTNPRAALVAQTITASGTSAIRTGSANAVNWTTGRGWYADFPDTGERVHVNPKLDNGVLFVPSTVPTSTVCTPGGYGWLNYFDYKNFGFPNNIVSQKYDGPIVGINIFYTDKRHIGVVTANNPTPTQPPLEVPSSSPKDKFQEKHVTWREIIP